MTKRKYLPAAWLDLFLPLYDPLVKLSGGDKTRNILIEQAALQPHHRVLEIGCGTGTLLHAIKQKFPAIEAVGLDPDPRALKRAKLKLRKIGHDIRLDRGFSNELPYPDASFDRVFSSFMFHHVPDEEKQETLKEVKRVLKPNGSFHILDFDGMEEGHGTLIRWVHSLHRIKENSENKILALLNHAGFTTEVVQRGSLLFLPILYYRAL